MLLLRINRKLKKVHWVKIIRIRNKCNKVYVTQVVHKTICKRIFSSINEIKYEFKVQILHNIFNKFGIFLQ